MEEAGTRESEHRRGRKCEPLGCQHTRACARVCAQREREREDKRESKRDRETEGETERVLFGAASGRVSLADGCEQRGNKILPVSPAVLMGGEVF